MAYEVVVVTDVKGWSSVVGQGSDAQRDWLARGPAEVRRLIEFATSLVQSGPDRLALESEASEALTMVDAMEDG